MCAGCRAHGSEACSIDTSARGKRQACHSGSTVLCKLRVGRNCISGTRPKGSLRCTLPWQSQLSLGRGHGMPSCRCFFLERAMHVVWQVACQEARWHKMCDRRAVEGKYCKKRNINSNWRFASMQRWLGILQTSVQLPWVEWLMHMLAM